MWIGYYFSRFLIYLLIKFIYRFKVKVIGKENIASTGPFILISNHLSFLDPALIGTSCKRRFVFIARQDLFENKFLGAWMRWVNVIAVKRDSPDLKAIKLSISALNKGEALLMFPEGTRQEDSGESFQSLRKGFLLLAKKAKVPIVVAKIYGTDLAWPRNAKKINRGTEITVKFAKPFILEDNEDYPQGLSRLQSALGGL